MPQGIKLDLGRQLAQLRQQSPLTAEAVGHLMDAINRLADNTATSPIGELPPPPPVDSVAVSGTLSNNVLTAPGEILHFVHTHNTPINRGISYLTEIDTDPSFPAPHVIAHTTSRSGFVHLPSTDTTTPVPVQHTYYLRVTPQYQGSKPAVPTVFGGLQGPTAIQMTGTTATNLLPSQAAGTAKPGQGGQGLGPVRSRGAVGGPKRQLS